MRCEARKNISARKDRLSHSAHPTTRPLRVCRTAQTSRGKRGTILSLLKTPSDVAGDWTPQACTGWAAAGFTTLVTTVARFRYSSDAEGLLRHIGAISALAGMRYWSTTHKAWQHSSWTRIP